MSDTKKRYCRAWNAGLASETPAVNRRLARLLQALDEEITSNVVEGEIVEDVWRFRTALREKLEADGFEISYRGGNRLRVYEPGSPTGRKVREEREERAARHREEAKVGS